MDAQYTKLRIERTIYENLQSGIKSYEEEKEQHANIVSILLASMNSGDDSTNTKHPAPLVVSPVDPSTSGKEIDKDIESAMADDSWVNEYLQKEASTEEKPVTEDTGKTEETETETKRLISEGSP